MDDQSAGTRKPRVAFYDRTNADGAESAVAMVTGRQP
jgi:hypothetical protein